MNGREVMVVEAASGGSGGRCSRGRARAAAVASLQKCCVSEGEKTRGPASGAHLLTSPTASDTNFFLCHGHGVLVRRQ